MTLHTGKYIVSNKAHDLYLGRGINEDTSLHPKAIVTLPGGVRAPTWKVERLHDGRYKLAVLVHDSPHEYYVAEIDGKVFAILNPKGPVKPTEWTIKQVEGHGEKVYLVEAHSQKVWAVPEKKPYTQVILEIIIVLAKGQDEVIPLPYSPTQLFTFYPVPKNEDDASAKVSDK